MICTILKPPFAGFIILDEFKQYGWEGGGRGLFQGKGIWGCHRMFLELPERNSASNSADSDTDATVI